MSAAHQNNNGCTWRRRFGRNRHIAGTADPRHPPSTLQAMEEALSGTGSYRLLEKFAPGRIRSLGKDERG
jgi:hypothetical protein